jgi:hypothetical protein
MTTDLFCLFFPFLIYEFITGLLTREKRRAETSYPSGENKFTHLSGVCVAHNL